MGHKDGFTWTVKKGKVKHKKIKVGSGDAVAVDIDTNVFTSDLLDGIRAKISKQNPDLVTDSRVCAYLGIKE